MRSKLGYCKARAICRAWCCGLMLSLVSCWCSAAGLAGFDKLRWNMTRQEVQAKYPNFEEWNEKANSIFIGDYIEHQFGLKSYFVAGCEFALTLNFVENKLSQISLSESFEHRADCAEDIERMLRTAYGKDKKRKPEANDSIRFLEWEVGETAIVFSDWSKGMETPHVEVTYSNMPLLRSSLLDLTACKRYYRETSSWNFFPRLYGGGLHQYRFRSL